MSELVFNVGLRANAQSGAVGVREVRRATDMFARFIVDDVAYTAREESYNKLRGSIQAGVRQAVAMEVSKMAASIARSFVLSDRFNGPHGTMSAGGGLSDTARQLGYRLNFNRAETGIKWKKRGKHYLNWKAQHNKSLHWWKLNGDLIDALSDEQMYLDKFGPIQVVLRRPTNQERAQKRTAAPITNIARSQFRGRRSGVVQVAQLQVAVFGKITPQMIPALGMENPHPKFAASTNNHLGLAGLMDGSVRTKLVGRQAERRYALEPFVSFYLTRAIPNAIWRRVESAKLL